MLSLALTTLLKKKKIISEFFHLEPSQKLFVTVPSESHQLAFTCLCTLGRVEEGSSWPAGTELEYKAEGTSHSRKCMEEEDLKKTILFNVLVLTEN